MAERSQFRWKQLLTASSFILTGTGIVLLAFAGLPFYNARQEPLIASSYAETVSRELQTKLNDPQSEILRQDDSDGFSLMEIGRTLIRRDIFRPLLDSTTPTGSSEGSIETQQTLESILAEPLKRRSTETIQDSSPLLSGILIDGASAQAVINDEMVAKGDFVLGYRVVGIFRNSVLLSKENTILELRLEGN